MIAFGTCDGPYVRLAGDSAFGLSGCSVCRHFMHHFLESPVQGCGTTHAPGSMLTTMHGHAHLVYKQMHSVHANVTVAQRQLVTLTLCSYTFKLQDTTHCTKVHCPHTDTGALQPELHLCYTSSQRSSAPLFLPV
jgi:hypothetical protein